MYNVIHDNMIYMCNNCKYQTNRKSDYTKHCKTIKHILNEHPHKMSHKLTNANNVNKYQCHNCDKSFKYKSGLCRHEKACKQRLIVSEDTYTNKDIKSMFSKLINENKELQKQVIDIANRPTIINQTTTNHIKKSVNFIQFLNTDCKDAYNLSDYIKQFEIGLDDLLHIYDNGYVEGLKLTFIKRLVELEETKRPIHCTDIKRKCFYIKDENIWDRDLNNNKLYSAIREINSKQIQSLNHWKSITDSNINEENTNIYSCENITDTHEKILQITNECTKLYTKEGDKLKNKIVHELSYQMLLDKKV